LGLGFFIGHCLVPERKIYMYYQKACAGNRKFAQQKSPTSASLVESVDCFLVCIPFRFLLFLTSKQDVKFQLLRRFFAKSTTPQNRYYIHSLKIRAIARLPRQRRFPRHLRWQHRRPRCVVRAAARAPPVSRSLLAMHLVAPFCKGDFAAEMAGFNKAG